MRVDVQITQNRAGAQKAIKAGVGRGRGEEASSMRAGARGAHLMGGSVGVGAPGCETAAARWRVVQAGQQGRTWMTSTGWEVGVPG